MFLIINKLCVKWIIHLWFLEKEGNPIISSLVLSFYFRSVIIIHTIRIFRIRHLFCPLVSFIAGIFLIVARVLLSSWVRTLKPPLLFNYFYLWFPDFHAVVGLLVPVGGRGTRAFVYIVLNLYSLTAVREGHINFFGTLHLFCLCALFLPHNYFNYPLPPGGIFVVFSRCLTKPHTYITPGFFRLPREHKIFPRWG